MPSRMEEREMAKEQAKQEAKARAKEQAKQPSKPGPQTPMNPSAISGGKDSRAPRRHARTGMFAGSARGLIK